MTSLSLLSAEPPLALNSTTMGDASSASAPRIPPTHFSSVAYFARDLFYRGFVRGQTLSVSCLGPWSTKLSSSATLAHDVTVGTSSATLVEGQRKCEITFSTLCNQISGTTFLNVLCPGMTVALSTSISDEVSSIIKK